MKILFVVNDPPYGTERSYNALRLAGALVRHDPQPEVTVFLLADAVSCAKRGQKVPQGFYNIELMVKSVLRGGGEVLLCGTCLDARGLVEAELVEGTRRSSLDALAEQSLAADRVLTF